MSALSWSYMTRFQLHLLLISCSPEDDTASLLSLKWSLSGSDLMQKSIVLLILADHLTLILAQSSGHDLILRRFWFICLIAIGLSFPYIECCNITELPEWQYKLRVGPNITGRTSFKAACCVYFYQHKVKVQLQWFTVKCPLNVKDASRVTSSSLFLCILSV